MQQQQQQGPWEIERMMHQRNVGGRGMRALCVAASPDCFFTGSVDGTVHVWDAASGTWKARLTGGHGVGLRVLGLAVSQKDHQLFSGAHSDPHLPCWDVEHGRVVRSYRVGDSGVHRLAFDPSLNILVASDAAEEVCLIFDTRVHAAGAPVLTLISYPAHTSRVLSILTQPSQPHVLTGSSDSTIKLWDLARPAFPISTLSWHRSGVRALAMVPSQQGRGFASASVRAIKTFTLSEGHPPRHGLSMSPGSSALAINGDDVMASASFDGTLCFWDCNTGTELQYVQSPHGGYPEVDALSFDTTGTRLVACERNGAITMWKQTVTI